MSAPGLIGFSSWLFGPFAAVLWKGQSITVERADHIQAILSWQPGSYEKDSTK